MTFLPIVERELRVVARRPSTQWLRIGVAAALIVVVLLVLVGSSPYASPHRLAQELMRIMGLPALGFCLLAGVFLTADCLSRERREGTLGLLFLTDLKGYDVTLGKLAATSVHAIYGLLAIFPVMALPLLMGGVSVGEFGRLLLVLIVTLFLSLSAGLLVSSITRETRHAMLGTFVLMLLWTGGFPALSLVLRLFFRSEAAADLLLLPSPFSAHMLSLDFMFRNVPTPFWISLGLSGGLALALLAWATWRVPRIWQDRDLPGRSHSRRSFLDWLRYGTPARRASHRAQLAQDPFYWLTTRRRLGQVLAWVMLGGLGAVWACFFSGAYAVSARGQREELFVFSVLVAFGLHAVFKILVALEATSRLSEDRQSGVLELLLATPLPPLAIVQGQRRALRERCGLPMLAVALVNLALFWAIVAPNPLHLHLSSVDRVLFSAVLLGGIAVLSLDYYALSWVGPWLALRSRRQHLAVLGTLGRLLLPSWVALLMFGFLVANTWVGSEEAVKALTTAWFVGSAVLALYAATHARRRLRRDFRSLAARGGGAAAGR